MTVVHYMHRMLTCLADKRTRVDRYRRGSDTDTATNTKAKTAIVPALAVTMADESHAQGIERRAGGDCRTVTIREMQSFKGTSRNA
jgi:hypothetical protein